MAEIPDGLYDNQATWSREYYHDGKLHWAITAEALLQKGAARFLGIRARARWGHYPDVPRVE